MRIDFDSADLRPLIRECVVEVLDRLEGNAARLDSTRLAFTEAEAAKLLGVPAYTLRDARYRNELKGRKVGKRWCYSRAELLRFLGEEGE
jgi:excisionase family DNA binding protein